MIVGLNSMKETTTLDYLIYMIIWRDTHYETHTIISIIAGVLCK